VPTSTATNNAAALLVRSIAQRTSLAVLLARATSCSIAAWSLATFWENTILPSLSIPHA